VNNTDHVKPKAATTHSHLGVNAEYWYVRNAPKAVAMLGLYLWRVYQKQTTRYLKVQVAKPQQKLQ
jgi:hypothetical protein